MTTPDDKPPAFTGQFYNQVIVSADNKLLGFARDGRDAAAFCAGHPGSVARMLPRPINHAVMQLYTDRGFVPVCVGDEADAMTGERARPLRGVSVEISRDGVDVTVNAPPGTRVQLRNSESGDPVGGTVEVPRMPAPITEATDAAR